MRRIGKYEICGLLGKGGMGKVYKVRMPVVGKVVALKLLAPHENLVALLGEDELKRLFLTEAVTMARLRHPNIVAIWDFHDDEDGTFFVMEYFCNDLGAIIGETYRVEEPSRRVSVDKALHYTRQMLSGLSRLHQAGIIHRDMKPFNVLVTDHDVVKITDFGLSKLRGETFQGPGNLLVGSPYYAAPEQEADPDEVDVRADLYPVGVMLYRMLTGELPIDAFRSLREFNPDLDDPWDDFLQKSTARDREGRFPNARTMLASLDELQGVWEEKKERACRLPAAVGPEQTAPPHAPKPPRRERIKVRPRHARPVFGADACWRPVHFLTNQFEDNGDGTVFDRATGLLWEQAGSDYPMTWQEAHEYVEVLNQRGFAGQDDWRMPTIEELMTLLTDVPRAGDLCIEPIFDPNARWLWSSDRCSFVSAWFVSVDMGYIARQDFSCYYYVRAVSSSVSPPKL